MLKCGGINHFYSHEASFKRKMVLEQAFYIVAFTCKVIKQNLLLLPIFHAFS
jgi:hypothetical protein